MGGKRLLGLAVAAVIAVALVGSRTDSTATSTTIASATKMIANVSTAF